MAGALGAVLLLAGCNEVEESAAAVHEPATVEELPGVDVKRVTFDEEGAERVSLVTAQVLSAASGTVVPYAALIYDAQGVVWVYTSPEPLTFQRAEVVVDRIVDDLAYLTEGPEPGTEVVTVGATQVYGAELNISGGH